MKHSTKNKYQRHYRSGSYKPESWWDRREQGYGMDLYRNSRDGKLAGVCAGLGDHFNVDHWVIRLFAIGGLIFLNSLMVFAYLGAWFVLAPRPAGGTAHQQYRYDENLHQDRPVNMFRYQTDPTDRLRTARQRLDEVNNRVSTMERYVTSRRYELDKEFSKMEGH